MSFSLPKRWGARWQKRAYPKDNSIFIQPSPEWALSKVSIFYQHIAGMCYKWTKKNYNAINNIFSAFPLRYPRELCLLIIAPGLQDGAFLLRPLLMPWTWQRDTSWGGHCWAPWGTSSRHQHLERAMRRPSLVGLSSLWSLPLPSLWVRGVCAHCRFFLPQILPQPRNGHSGLRGLGR